MRSMMFAVTALALVTACGEVRPGPDGGTGGGSGGGGGTASGYRCTTGAVFAGNPTFPDPMMRPVEGAGLREGAPYNFRTVVFSQGQLISHSGQDLWRASLSG